MSSTTGIPRTITSSISAPCLTLIDQHEKGESINLDGLKKGETLIVLKEAVKRLNSSRETSPKVLTRISTPSPSHSPFRKHQEGSASPNSPLLNEKVSGIFRGRIYPLRSSVEDDKTSDAVSSGSLPTIHETDDDPRSPRERLDSQGNKLPPVFGITGTKSHGDLTPPQSTIFSRRSNVRGHEDTKVPIIPHLVKKVTSQGGAPSRLPPLLHETAFREDEVIDLLGRLTHEGCYCLMQLVTNHWAVAVQIPGVSLLPPDDPIVLRLGDTTIRDKAICRILQNMTSASLDNLGRELSTHWNRLVKSNPHLANWKP